MTRKRTSPIQADAQTDLRLITRINTIWKQAIHAIQINLSPQLLQKGKSVITQQKLLYGRYFSLPDQKEWQMLPIKTSTHGFNDLSGSSAFLVNSQMIPVCENDLAQVNIVFVFTWSRKETNSDAYYKPANAENPIPLIVVYMKFMNEQPLYYDQKTIDNFKKTLEALKSNSHYLSLFQHEYTHYYEDITSKKGILTRNRKKFNKGTKGDYTGYINSSHEVNARYVQIAGKVWTLTKQYKAQNTTLIQMLPTFDDFFTLIWHPDYAPSELINHATPATKRRLIKRLYGLYLLFKNQKPTQMDVARFVQTQLKAA